MIRDISHLVYTCLYLFIFVLYITDTLFLNRDIVTNTDAVTNITVGDVVVGEHHTVFGGFTINGLAGFIYAGVMLISIFQITKASLALRGNTSHNFVMNLNSIVWPSICAVCALILVMTIYTISYESYDSGWSEFSIDDEKYFDWFNQTDGHNYRIMLNRQILSDQCVNFYQMQYGGLSYCGADLMSTTSADDEISKALHNVQTTFGICLMLSTIFGAFTMVVPHIPIERCKSVRLGMSHRVRPNYDADADDERMNYGTVDDL